MKFILCILYIFCFSYSFSQLTPIIDSIPLRDGKKLAADIFIPSGSQQRPTILIQTPYNRILYRYNLPIGIGLNIDSANYNIVTVDWRGFYGSISAWISNPNRGEDGYDVIEWISNQSWSNGETGTWGPSALGKIQYQTAKEKHPGHTCAVPLVAGSQFNYLEYFPGGVYRKEYVDQLDALGYGMAAILLSMPYYSNIWQTTENQTFYPADIEIPMLMIGGWFDHNTDLMLDLFNGIRQQSPISSQQKLLMGPWAHGGFGAAQVGTAQQGELFFYEAAGWSDSLALMFFNYHLLNSSNGWELNPVYQYFQMGENTWESTSIWPPIGVTNYHLYFRENEELLTQQPVQSTSESIIIYDPCNPSPTYGGETLRQDLLQGPYNQADTVESRNDILSFTSPILTQDVKMKGSPHVHLFVSSDRPDTDFSVRLTDVYPDGKSILLSDGIFRMRFRNGFTTGDTASMIPGNIYEIDIPLKNLAHTFLAGHQIRLGITSSNYPRFDKNLNNGGAMYTSGDTLIATNTIYHNSVYGSYASFPFTDYPSRINKLSTLENILLFPNPGKDFVNIKVVCNIDCPFHVGIFNVYGNKLMDHKFYNVKGVNSHRLNIESLYPGIYQVIMKTNDQVYIKKYLIYD